jgi:hypothetical protein
MFLFAKCLLYDETTYLERFLHFWKYVSITRGFCMWNMGGRLEFSTAIVPEILIWSYALHAKNWMMHVKISLLKTWMQMMTVSSSWAAWQSITSLILYATVD